MPGLNLKFVLNSNISTLDSDNYLCLLINVAVAICPLGIFPPVDFRATCFIGGDPRVCFGVTCLCRTIVEAVRSVRT